MGIQDISWWNLAIGYLLLAIPILISRYYQMKLTKDLLWSVGRMTLQLALVGLYLEFIFQLNNRYLNIAWVLLMLGVTALTVLQRTKMDRKLFFAPFFSALFISNSSINLFMMSVVLQLDNWSEASYLIPIAGMLIGNSLADLVTSITTFNSSLAKQSNTYRFALANGATHGEALRPFMRDALKISLNRGVANMAVMGLVSLPGMMTGQILGGSSPQVAIKYQILIMLTIFVSSTITIFLALYFARKRSFDSYLNPII